MTTELVQIDKLKPAPYNPRTVSQHEFESLQRSIDQWGFVEPIVVNKTTGFIVGGHARVEAAKALQYTEVPVVWVELDPQNERALNVALNNIGGEFDTDQLAELIAGLDDELKDLTGFTEDEINKLQDGWVDEDEAKEDKPKSDKYSLKQLRDLVKSYHDEGAKGHINNFLDWIDREAR